MIRYPSNAIEVEIRRSRREWAWRRVARLAAVFAAWAAVGAIVWMGVR